MEYFPSLIGFETTYDVESLELGALGVNFEELESLFY